MINGLLRHSGGFGIPVFLAWLFLAGGPGRASTVVPPHFPELVNEADYIVRAIVKSVTAEKRLSPTGKVLIFSRVELDVKEVVAGKPPAPLVLVVLGGKTSDLEMSIADAPKFAEGEESIFFVQGNGKQVCPLVRMMHGLYRIRRENVHDRKYVSRSNGEPLQNVTEVSGPMHEEPMTASAADERATRALSPEDFILKIRAAVAKDQLRDH